MEKIQWAPKVSRSKIWRLYQNDARGAVDEALVDDVGWALLQRCLSIIRVSRRQVECPRCGHVFDVPAVAGLFRCQRPDCAWETTVEAWHNSWRHQDLIGSNALTMFESFVADYASARSVRERTFHIDRLIHAFHWDAKQQLPNRSVGNNLIVGSHQAVVAFLEMLSYGDKNGIGSDVDKAHWRETVKAMWKRRGASR